MGTSVRERRSASSVRGQYQRLPHRLTFSFLTKDKTDTRELRGENWRVRLWGKERFTFGSDG